MKIIGLTGNSGSGKTTACEFFKSAGFEIIDCDKLAREVVQKGQPCLLELCAFFGTDILNEDGTLNRKKLAEIAFADKELTQKLNEITHKYIIQRVNSLIENYKTQNETAVIIDAPVLYESGLDKICDFVVAVTADEDIRIERLALRDSITQDQAKQRFKHQKTAQFYKQNADFVITNNDNKEILKQNIDHILIKLKGE